MKRFALLIALLSPTVAHADPYTILAGGDLVFNASLTTWGTFRCGSVVSCSSTGDSLTLSSESGSATLSFTGIQRSFEVGNITTPVTLGTFSGVDSGFLAPSTANIYVPLFYFTLSLEHSSPMDERADLTWKFGPSLSRISGGTYVTMLAGPNPPGYRYSYLIYTLGVTPLTLPTNGSRALNADVGAVPEPASMLLLGTGIAGLWLRRRRA